jgi:hypothetical protein
MARTQVKCMNWIWGPDYWCYVTRFGGGEAAFFMLQPDLSSAGADYEEEEANFVLQR